ncbi:MAG: oligoendopeptidase F [Spirochaetes bacterium]|nr:oligoendopeptidase F [Spirochaetota bacterium]
MPTKFEIPLRKDIPLPDTWDLSALYDGPESWERDFQKFEAFAEAAESFRGTPGSSKAALAAALGTVRDGMRLGECLSCYVELRVTEDEGDSASRSRAGRFMMAQAKAQGAWSWLEPELQRIPDASVNTWLEAPELAEFRVYLRKILRFKPHVLSEAEERLLALQLEKDSTAQETFSVLTNVDMDFGSVDTAEGPRPLSQSTFASFMQDRDRDLRKRAYDRFYAVFDGHRNAVASLYQGSCQVDRYRAQVRRYGSSREASLFPDDVPASVYDNLVSTINANLPALHGYYGIRRRALKLDALRHYDVYVPIVDAARTRHSYAEAVDVISDALAPLGEEYVGTLKAGLLGRWVDRYENRGKRSGAFSAGSYSGDPYILMNYKEEVIRDMFTLAHEAGHSMHSWYSARSNPFMHYGCTIFEAEVASTFNEQLLFACLYGRADSKQLKTYLVNSRVDDLLATLYRQTMFAEFEKLSHEALESGTPLTVDFLRAEYRKLLVKYFGPEMVFEDSSDLECLRIPHFYNAFYVYKYATGVSAAIALSRRVLGGGARERDDYFAFLRSGGSRFPIESLKLAGVDMSSPGPVQAACDEFARLAGELGSLLGE